MAVPFNSEEDESEEQMERLHQLFSQFLQVLTQILDQLQQQQQQSPTARFSRLASCGDADDEDDDEEDPPGAAAMAVAASQLPDVVPRPAPRLSLSTPQPAPRRPPTKWPAQSPFTKYITAASTTVPLPRVPVAVSRTTCCFNLPDVVRDAVDPAPSRSAAPAAAPMAAAKAAPSPAPRRPSGAARPALARCHPPEQAARPAPKPTPSKRRPGKEAQLLAAELAAAVTKCAAPAPPTLRGDWLQRREDELDKMVKHAASPDQWVGIGNDLRELADCFDKTLTSVDVVDGPDSPARTSLLRSLLSLVTKGSLESKFITTTIVLYCGKGLYSYFRR